MGQQGLLINEDGSQKWEIRSGQRLMIGRGADARGGHIHLEHPTVSKHHARICCEGDFFLEDLDSTNGTGINGIWMLPGEKRRLSDGDQISFGSQRLCFQISKGKRAAVQVLSLPFFWDHSWSGRRLCCPVGDMQVISYQLRMIEENPFLGIPSCRHIRSIGGDQLLYEADGMQTLSEVLEKQALTPLSWCELLMQTLLLIRKGQSCMLFKEQYALTPETVWFSNDHNQEDGKMKIIYIPAILEREGDFGESFYSFARSLFERIEKTQKEEEEFLIQLKEGAGDPAVALRMLSCLRSRMKWKEAAGEEALECKEPDLSKAEGKKGRFFFLKENRIRKKEKQYTQERRETGKADPGGAYKLMRFFIAWKVPFLSYGLFVILYWWEVLNPTELAGLALALGGLNLYLLRRREKEEQDL